MAKGTNTVRPVLSPVRCSGLLAGLSLTLPYPTAPGPTACCHCLHPSVFAGTLSPTAQASRVVYPHPTRRQPLMRCPLQASGFPALSFPCAAQPANPKIHRLGGQAGRSLAVPNQSVRATDTKSPDPPQSGAMDVRRLWLQSIL